MRAVDAAETATVAGSAGAVTAGATTALSAVGSAVVPALAVALPWVGIAAFGLGAIAGLVAKDRILDTVETIVHDLTE